MAKDKEEKTEEELLAELEEVKAEKEKVVAEKQKEKVVSGKKYNLVEVPTATDIFFKNEEDDTVMDMKAIIVDMANDIAELKDALLK